MYAILLLCQILIITLLPDIFVVKKYKKRLRKYKKGPFGLSIEIMTLAMNHCL